MNLRHTLMTAVLLAFTLGAFVLSAPVGADQSQLANRSLYIFGDSWAQQMSETGTPIPFDQQLIDHEFDSFVTLHKHGISGSTLQDWAEDVDGNMTALLAAIAVDPSVNPLVFFTLGGNDIRDGRTQIEMATDLATILTALEATRADVQVIYGSYDILNPTVSPICVFGLEAIFGTSDPLQVNTLLYAAQQGAATVAANFGRTTAVDLFGTLQGNTGMPDLSAWSPIQYVTSDCLHLNSDGYNTYIEALFDTHLTSTICEDPEVTSSACATTTYIYLPMLMNNELMP